MIRSPLIMARNAFLFLQKRTVLEYFISYSLVFCFLVSIFIHFKTFTEDHLPYVGHWDEPYLTASAAEMLKSNKLKPSHFYYPAMPMYMTALGMAFGYFADALDKNVYSPENIGRYDFPHHERENVIRYARSVFITLSILCIFFGVLISNRVSGSALASVLVVPALVCSSTFIEQARNYINVDIVSTFFVLASLCYALHVNTLKFKASFLYRIVIPAILCACAISSKYNYFPIVFVFLYTIFRHVPRWHEDTILFLTLVALCFFAINPYILLDYSQFMYYTAIQMESYSNGYVGNEANPGWDQIVFHLAPILKEYSLTFLVCAGFGIYHIRKLNAEHFNCLALFSVPYIAIVVSQRLHYLRNFLPIYVLIVVFWAAGVVFVYRFSKEIFIKKFRRRVVASCLASACLVVLLPMSIKFSSIGENLSSSKDTRNTISDILNQNIQTSASVLVAEEIGFSEKSLQHFDLVKFNRKELEAQIQFINKMKNGSFLVIPMYTNCSNKDVAATDSLHFSQELEQQSIIKVFSLPGAPYCIDSPKPISSYSPYLTLYYKP